MKSSLLRSDPRAIRRMTGSSRSAAMPCTYCGVTAVSSTTTPAAFALARPAAAPMSSTDAEAIRASVAMSSNSPNSPALMPENLSSSHRLLSHGLLSHGLLSHGPLECGRDLVRLGRRVGQLHRLVDAPLRRSERVDGVGQHPRDRRP